MCICSLLDKQDLGLKNEYYTAFEIPVFLGLRLSVAVSLRACCTPPPLHCFQEKLKVASKDKDAGGLGPL